MEMELTQTHFVAKDNDTQLRGKIASLEAQLSELETARQAEQQAAEYKCVSLYLNVSTRIMQLTFLLHLILSQCVLLFYQKVFRLSTSLFDSFTSKSF